MKKIIFRFLALIIFVNHAFSAELEQAGIGEEYIEPLRYPKFSAWFEYGMMRKFHNLDNSKLHSSLPHNLGSAFSFEAGLYRYFNAGGLFSFNFPLERALSPIPLHFRFALFAKPYWPITKRISIFSRLGGGLSLSFFNQVLSFRGNQNLAPNYMQELSNTYGEQEYSLMPFGFNAMATVGIETFIFSRMGLALEWGFRGDFFYASKSPFLMKISGGDKRRNPPKAAHAAKYFVYEMPLMLTLNIII